jgi:hypothetical protein
MKRPGSAHAFGTQGRLAALDHLLIALLAAVLTSPIWVSLVLLALIVWGAA